MRSHKRPRAVVLAAVLGLSMVGAACTATSTHPRPFALTNPERITVAAPDMSGVKVKVASWIWDPGNYHAVASCNTPPGDWYPIGETVVTCGNYDYVGQWRSKTTIVVVTPPTGDRVVQIDTMPHAACAVYQQGSLRCWGDYARVIGNGHIVSSPVEIGGITTATNVDVLSSHVCALLAEGTVECWGERDGPDDLPTTATPQPVSGLTDVVDIDDGCALISNGTVKCFSPTLGGPAHVPPGLTNAVAIDGTCALLADTTVSCWGRNDVGQLGTGTTNSIFNPPTPVPGVSGVTEIASRGIGCGVLSDSTLECWGPTNWGATGTFDPNEHPHPQLPTPVSGLTGVTAVDSSGFSTCAVMADGTAKCWGLDYFGSLGHGNVFHTAMVPTGTPVAVAGLTGVVQLSITTAAGCALLGDGTVRCWGGSGLLDGSVVPIALMNEPVGTTSISPIPVTVSGLD